MSREPKDERFVRLAEARVNKIIKRYRSFRSRWLMKRHASVFLPL